MLIKTVRVTNSRNVLVQVPGFIVGKWGLSNNDKLEVLISEDERSVIIRPRSDSNQDSERLVGGTR